MTDALRAEVNEYGVDAVLIEPGPVDTGFTQRAESEIEGVERSGAYDAFYSTFEDTQVIGGGGPGAVSPERVAEDILNAASSTKPAGRVPVGTFARIGLLGRFVPDRLRDRAFGLLDKLR
jgi:short-subunit dehydrogenase